MKFRSLAIAVSVMAFGAVMAHAAPSQLFGVGGGLTLPTGDASKVTSTGFYFGGTYCYKLNPQFGLGADVNYHMLGEKDQGLFDGVDVKTTVNALYFGLSKTYRVPKHAKVEYLIELASAWYRTRQFAVNGQNEIVLEE
jgi:hypothetical protein